MTSSSPLPSPDCRVLLLSDLHLEMHDYTPATEGFDVAVLAGDIHTKGRGVAWAMRSFQVPVVYVLGNHEGYGGHWERTLGKMREEAAGSHVHILHRDEVVLEGVRFLGVTAWSDFTLWPDPYLAMEEAGKGRDAYSTGMRDYRHIRTAGFRRIRPTDTLLWNREDKRWLEKALAVPSEHATVVVTHHPPTARSLEHPVAEPLDAADANSWDDLVERSGAVLWCHGHTHHPVDFMMGRTRIGSNPRGYPGQQLAHRLDGIWTVPRQGPQAAVGAGQVWRP